MTKLSKEVCFGMVVFWGHVCGVWAALPGFALYSQSLDSPIIISTSQTPESNIKIRFVPMYSKMITILEALVLMEPIVKTKNAL